MTKERLSANFMQGMTILRHCQKLNKAEVVVLQDFLKDRTKDDELPEQTPDMPVGKTKGARTKKQA